MMIKMILKTTYFFILLLCLPIPSYSLTSASYDQENSLETRIFKSNLDSHIFSWKKEQRMRNLSLKKELPWINEQERRLTVINNYFRINSDSYRNFVFGANGRGPIPSVMLALFSELFPEMWGGDYFEKLGFGPPLDKHPFLPLGISESEEILVDETLKPVLEGGKPVTLNYSGFNCVSCHSGFVKTAEGVQPILGAPSSQIGGILYYIARTANRADFTEKNFLDALDKKQQQFIKGWLHENQAIEETQIATFKKYSKMIVEQVKSQSLQLTKGAQLYLNFVYNPQNPTRSHLVGQRLPPQWVPGEKEVDVDMPGQMEAFAATNIRFAGFIHSLTTTVQSKEALSELEKYFPILNELTKSTFGGMAKLSEGNNFISMEQAQAIWATQLPMGPAPVDSPSIWSQADRGQYNHWDGILANSSIHRNAGATQAGLSRPVNISNIAKTTEFLKDFPSYPYPFKDVNNAKARKGHKLFQKHCSSCHSGTNRHYAVGTDPKRSGFVSAAAGEYLGNLLTGTNYFLKKGICPKESTHCQKSDSSNFLGSELVVEAKTVNSKVAYTADRLDGLWARAPYLHNGSVPTLKQLLVPELRAEKFCRGWIEYDQNEVGFRWALSNHSNCEPNGRVYDTLVYGSANKGHDTIEILGLDWGRNKNKLDYLINYLKTL